MPSSTGLGSSTSATIGALDALKSVLHGQLPGTTETVEPEPAFSRLPLSSIARVRMATEPGAPGVQSKVHDAVPCAAFQVVPPSTDTSTPATTPPLSDAVPVMVMRSPLPTVPPLAGEVTTDVGANTSDDLADAISGRDGSAPICSEPGCAPKSANRLMVACCI